MKFEYRVVIEQHGSDAERVLIKLGAQGWRVVTFGVAMAGEGICQNKTLVWTLERELEAL